MFKLSVSHQREGRKSWLLEKTKRHNLFQPPPPTPPNIRQKDWRNSFTKNTPWRVKLKLNIIAVKRKQASTMQWHQFPGVPGILLATLSRQCLYTLTPLQKYCGTKRLFTTSNCLCHKTKIKHGDSDCSLLGVNTASILGNNSMHVGTITFH